MPYKQIEIWHYKAELARGEETGNFKDKVNSELKKMGNQVDKVYAIGVGHDLVITAVLNKEKLEEEG
jgi:hypothetical protein